MYCQRLEKKTFNPTKNYFDIEEVFIKRPSTDIEKDLSINDEIEYAISSFEDFQKIETSVLKAMVWTPVPIYSLPDMESKDVIELKNIIKGWLETSFQKLNEYVSKLECFDDFADDCPELCALEPADKSLCEGRFFSNELKLL